MRIVDPLANRLEALSKIRRQEGTLSAGRKAMEWLLRQQRYALRGQVYSPLDLEGLRALCSQHGRYWQYEMGCEIRSTDKAVPTNQPETFRRRTKTYTVSPSYVYEVPNGRLVDVSALGKALAVTENDEVILESLRKPSKFHTVLSSRSFPGRPLLSRGSSSDRTCIFPLIGADSSFFIWIHEFLPKLLAWESYRQRTGTTPDVVVEPDPPRWVPESLELVGVPATNIVELDADRLYADTLVLATHRRHNVSTDYNPQPPRQFEWLAREMTEGIAPEESGDRVYISRRDADRRRVVNEDEVVDALEARGFRTCTLAEKPFEEQVRILSRAETIVAPHGGGLVHMLWAEDPTVIEILPESYLRPTYYLLAHVLDYEYELVIGETPNRSSQPREDDVYVDVDELCARCDSRLPEPRGSGERTARR